MPSEVFEVKLGSRKTNSITLWKMSFEEIIPGSLVRKPLYDPNERKLGRRVE